MLDYRFDDSVIQLNEFLKDNATSGNILITLIFLYYLIVCIIPAVLTIGPYGDTREGLRDSEAILHKESKTINNKNS